MFNYYGCKITFTTNEASIKITGFVYDKNKEGLLGFNIKIKTLKQ